MNYFVLIIIDFYLVDGGLMVMIVPMSLLTANTIRLKIMAFYGII
jgi:hypothetical protein